MNANINKNKKLNTNNIQNANLYANRKMLIRIKILNY